MAEWKALWSIDPWGDYRADVRNGILCQTIISLHLKKGAKPPPIEDFMVYEESEKEDGRMDEDQIKDFCEKLAANFKR